MVDIEPFRFVLMKLCEFYGDFLTTFVAQGDVRCVPLDELGLQGVLSSGTLPRADLSVKR